MGNLCSSERDPFSQPGRPLGTTPPARASVSVPASATAKPPRKVGGPPRTLGGGASPSSPVSSSSPTTPGGGGGGGGGDDARARAAAAAQARFDNSKAGGGKLQSQLDKQRGMTDAAALKQASEAQRRQRDLDQSAAALQHD